MSEQTYRDIGIEHSGLEAEGYPKDRSQIKFFPEDFGFFSAALQASPIRDFETGNIVWSTLDGSESFIASVYETEYIPEEKLFFEVYALTFLNAKKVLILSANNGIQRLEKTELGAADFQDNSDTMAALFSYEEYLKRAKQENPRLNSGIEIEMIVQRGTDFLYDMHPDIGISDDLDYSRAHQPNITTKDFEKEIE